MANPPSRLTLVAALPSVLAPSLEVTYTLVTGNDLGTLASAHIASLGFVKTQTAQAACGLEPFPLPRGGCESQYEIYKCLRLKPQKRFSEAR